MTNKYIAMPNSVVIYRLKNRLTGEAKLIASIENVEQLVKDNFEKYFIEILEVMERGSQLEDVFDKYDRYRPVIQTKLLEVDIPDTPKRGRQIKDDPQVNCECGGHHLLSNKKNHDRTKLHQRYAMNNTTA